MAEFLFRGKPVHYEVYGEYGKPLLLLNGIMMSTKSWQPFVRSFSEKNVLILVDFLDQGQSGRMEESYTQDIQAELVAELLERLWYSQVSIMGISYGGEVALQFALKYPERVERLILANTASRTSDWLREIGHAWNAVASSGDGRAYYLTTIPVIYSTKFYEERLDWMKNREKTLVPYFSNPEVLANLVRLTDSAEAYNVQARLGEITCPTLIISADADVLTPLTEQEILRAGIRGSKHAVIRESGHASMYEQPLLFASLVLGFVNAADTEFLI